MNAFINKFIPLVAYLIVFVLVLLVYRYFPKLIFILFYFNWIAVVACLIFFFGKKGKIKIQSHSTSTDQEHLLKIIFLQCALFFSFLITLVLFYKLNFPNLTGPDFVKDMSGLTSRFLYSYGVFPWALYSILIIAFAQRYFNERKRISLSRIIRPLIPHRQVGIISIGAHIYFRYITFLAVNFSLVLIAVAVGRYFLQNFHIPVIEGLNLKTMFLISLLTMPLGMAWGLPILEKIHRGCHLGSMIIILFFSFILVWISTSYLFLYFDNELSTLSIFNVIIPTWSLRIERIQELSFFSFCWWMGFSLPFCWQIARLSSGKSIQQLLTLTSVFPLFLIFVSLFPAVQSYVFHSVFQLSRSPIYLIIGSLLVLFFLFFFFSDKRNLFGFCSLTQKRLSFNAFKAFFQNTVLFFSLFLMTQLNMLYYFIVVMVVMGLIYLLSSVLSTLKHLCFD